MEEIQQILDEFKIIDNLELCLSTHLDDIHNKNCKRDRSIFFKDALYLLCYKNLYCCGTNVAINKLKNKLQEKDNKRKPFNFDESALRKFIDKIQVNDITIMNKALVELLEDNELEFKKEYELQKIKIEKGFMKNKYKKTSPQLEMLKQQFENRGKRFYAVDGTEIALPKEFLEQGCEKSTNGHYARAKLSGLFDINMKVPINFCFFTDNNERTALLKQIKTYLKEGDVIVCDRGYYSDELLYELRKLGIDVIMRMRDGNLIKPLKQGDRDAIKVVIKHKELSIPLRIIKYTLPNDRGINSTIYVSTTLSHKFTNQFIKEMYGKRWRVETNFYFGKYYLSLANLKYKKMHPLLINIEVLNFILILNSIIERTIIYDNITNNKNLDQNINVSHSLSTIVDDILKYTLYDDIVKSSKLKIIDAVANISNCTVKIRPGRHFPHIRKKAHPKFDIRGNIGDKKKRNLLNQINQNNEANNIVVNIAQENIVQENDVQQNIVQENDVQPNIVQKNISRKRDLSDSFKYSCFKIFMGNF